MIGFGPWREVFHTPSFFPVVDQIAQGPPDSPRDLSNCLHAGKCKLPGVGQQTDQVDRPRLPVAGGLDDSQPRP